MTTLKFHWQLRHRRCQSLRAVLQGKSASACQLDYSPVMHTSGFYRFLSKSSLAGFEFGLSVALKVQYVLHDSSRQCWSIKLKCPISHFSLFRIQKSRLISASELLRSSNNCHKLVLCFVGARTVKPPQTPNQLAG